MNIAQALTHRFPLASPFRDFEVRDDSDGNGPYLAVWNLRDDQGDPIPEPTDEELAQWYAEWEAAEAAKPQVELPEQKVARLESQLAAAQNDTLITMSALADVFEMVLDLQDQIAGGGSTP